jgi:vancomycin permeability regulator SanA
LKAGSRNTGFWRNALPRGLALFLGGFTLLNCFGEIRATHFDANLWWIDLRSIPQTVATAFLLFSGVCLVACAVRPPGSAWRRIATAACLVLLGIISLYETVVFFRLMFSKTISPGVPFPLSLVVSCALFLILAANLRVASVKNDLKTLSQITLVAIACLLAFPLAQIFFFGETDYRRPADVTVVLGARVYSDGRPSDALADRVRTACKLYRDGLTAKLLFSGGPGEGAIHETEAMKQMAIRLGVKEGDILCDRRGLNTLATVQNTQPALALMKASRVMVVSHFYHLPRIKLAYQRAGLDVCTVPAKQTYLLRQLPYSIAREVPAFWVYYLRPLIRA